MGRKNILAIHLGCPFGTAAAEKVVFHNLKHLFDHDKHIYILETDTSLPDMNFLNYAFREHGEVFCPSGVLHSSGKSRGIVFNYIRSRVHFGEYLRSFFNK